MLQKFLYLEGAYLILAGIILLVTLFVTTRPFMSPAALRKGVPAVAAVLAIFIGAHFLITTSRMAEVKAAFISGKPVLCESRMIRKVAQSVEIKKGVAGWRIEGDNFVSPAYVRPFHIARCIVK